MKILVVGAGGREHALVWKLVQSHNVDKVYAAPGNAGTAQHAENLPISATDFQALAEAVEKNKIDLTVVGPEIPLSEGIVDFFQARKLPVFGPTKDAARIESSKAFAKQLMIENKIPCAQGRSFLFAKDAKDYAETLKPPIVIKADGLAAGKGVVVAKSQQEAMATIDDMMVQKTYGAAGTRVVVEEFLEGKEVSLFSFTDGNFALPPVAACDYKRIGDDDTGPMTGGMGGYSPAYFITQQVLDVAHNTIVTPVLKALANEGCPYRGVIYTQAMVHNGRPRVVEFNARFGDPEAQLILPRIHTDIVEVMMGIARGYLPPSRPQWTDNPTVGIVMASGGYPAKYRTGIPIHGLNDVDKDVQVFHAGTKFAPDGKQVLTDGGRVLAVVARGKTLAEARERAYDNVRRISFEGAHYRKDIALGAVTTVGAR